MSTGKSTRVVLGGDGNDPGAELGQYFSPAYGHPLVPH